MKRFLKFAIIGYILLNVAIGAAGLILRRMVEVKDGRLEDEISLPAVFGGQEFTSQAASLSYARIVVFAGGALVDLSEAQLHPNGLDIEATTVMGGIDITVPRGCRVVLEPNTFMGGTNAPESEDELPPDAPEVRVRCTTVMGGLNVRYVDDDDPFAHDQTPEPALTA